MLNGLVLERFLLLGYSIRGFNRNYSVNAKLLKVEPNDCARV